MLATRFLPVVVASLVASTSLSTASAQTSPVQGYPKQPIRILSGFATGSTPDVVARLISVKLAERVGPTVVETKAGAGGMLAAEAAAQAAPDGYTLMLASISILSINPAVYSKLRYDAQKSFDVIGNVANYAFILSVATDHPAKDVASLVAWSKANPATANYGASSAMFQLLTELFKEKTGAKLEYIPFKGGSEIVTAILNGQVTGTFADAGAVMPQIKGGRVRPLATSGSKRMAELPDVPTLAEAGVPGVVVDGYTALIAPRGTPPAILEKLEAEVAAIRQMPDIRERLQQLGLTPSTETSADLVKRLARDVELWTAVAKAAGIKLD